MSPVISVRSNPENGMAVPVTLSSGGPRKRKPPPGALAMLEEELIARRTYWRRQRQHEKEITLREHIMAQMLLHDLDSVTSKTIQKFLEEIDVEVHTLSESEKREFQRRGGAEQEYSLVVPPDVIAVLTQGDANEHNCEEAHVSSHVKLCDVLRRFYNKLQQEEKQFKDRLGDLEGAMNPDAENTAMKRYRQAKNRLQAELQDHIITRMHGLDEAHSALEYARERSELCATESKLVLTHEALLAGDYDCQLSGVYGDVENTGEKDSELIPLLKQLIAMLESGGPFTLSSELLNLINAGTNIAGSQNTTNITNMGQGSDGDKHKQEQDSDSKKSKKKEKEVVKNVTSSMGGTKTGPGGKTSVEDGNIFGGKNQGSQAELQRAMFEKQAYEAAKLENDLKRKELDSINDTLDECEKNKKKAIDDAKADLEKKLSKVKSEQEREKVMMDYANNMQKLTESFEKNKQKQLDTLRQKLLEQRRQRKKDLHRKHIGEAQGQGLPVDSVPSPQNQSYEELMKDLLQLQKQQEEMMAEIRKKSAEEGDKVKQADIDKELEQQIKAMDLSKAQKEQMISLANERSKELKQQIEEMKEKLRQRKDRKKAGSLTADEDQNMSEEEKRKLMMAREMQNDADRMMEEQAILEAMKRLEEVRNIEVKYYCESTIVHGISIFLVFVGEPDHKKADSH